MNSDPTTDGITKPRQVVLADAPRRYKRSEPVDFAVRPWKFSRSEKFEMDGVLLFSSRQISQAMGGPRGSTVGVRIAKAQRACAELGTRAYGSL